MTGTAREESRPLARPLPSGHNDFDVVVCGAGPAGATYAYMLARAGASVLLAGTGPRHPPHSLELLDGRAGDVLTRCGLAETVVADAVRCAGVVGTWGQTGLLDKPALLDPYGGGWIIDRAVLDGRLVAAAVEAGAAHVTASVRTAQPVPPFKIDGIESPLAVAHRADRRWWVGTTAGSLHCGQVVIATGRTGRLPERCGIRRMARDRLMAAVGWVNAAIPDLGDRVRIDAVPSGWWYRIGYGAGTAAGFVTDTDLLHPGPDRMNATWRHAVGHLGWRTPAQLRLRPRAAHTAVLAELLSRDVAGLAGSPYRIPVIGDAALAVDPLSGHGLAIAFESAWRAASDPLGYREWLADTAAQHHRQEREIYAAAGYPGPFWRRRLA